MLGFMTIVFKGTVKSTVICECVDYCGEFDTPCSPSLQPAPGKKKTQLVRPGQSRFHQGYTPMNQREACARLQISTVSSVRA